MNRPTALITGANAGIGKAVANYFAHKSYNLVLIARDSQRLETVKQSLQTINADINIKAFSIDLGDMHQAYQQLTEIIKNIDNLSVVFNSAGIARYGTSETTLEDFDDLIDINTKGAFAVAKAAAAKMKQQQSGYIFNLASYAAKRQVPRTGSYSASKCALVGFSEALLIEMAAFNVKVTSLCPSVINTDMTKDFSIDNTDKLTTDDITSTIDYLLNLSPNAIIPSIDIQLKGFVTGQFTANKTFD
ncbi:MAG: SDR family NAD(P)-dependent oxidoreductase [Gammaproteobacteria bacterium]|nr:MAG: SDR family NAD(P)-dependent oxidoreductase [Gammaproteobacteria bacterium]UTW41992.1 SDR family NAD(P)-dependent oxidoreductase [bacterium SCSIO 12844]